MLDAGTGRPEALLDGEPGKALRTRVLAMPVPRYLAGIGADTDPRRVANLSLEGLWAPWASKVISEDAPELLALTQLDDVPTEVVAHRSPAVATAINGVTRAAFFMKLRPELVREPRLRRLVLSHVYHAAASAEGDPDDRRRLLFPILAEAVTVDAFVKLVEHDDGTLLDESGGSLTEVGWEGFGEIRRELVDGLEHELERCEPGTVEQLREIRYDFFDYHSVNESLAALRTTRRRGRVATLRQVENETADLPVDDVDPAEPEMLEREGRQLELVKNASVQRLYGNKTFIKRGGFVPVAKQLLEHAADLGITPVQLVIIIVVLGDRKMAPSRKKIARVLGCTERWVGEQLRDLERRGLARAEERANAHASLPNRYDLGGLFEAVEQRYLKAKEAKST